MTHVTPLLLAWLIAAVASVVLTACDDGHPSACSNATQQFNANPNDGTAQIVRQSCGME
jgi:uncharacterized lipoprotein YehR (DUF1307 family)